MHVSTQLKTYTCKYVTHVVIYIYMYALQVCAHMHILPHVHEHSEHKTVDTVIPPPLDSHPSLLSDNHGKYSKLFFFPFGKSLQINGVGEGEWECKRENQLF